MKEFGAASNIRIYDSGSVYLVPTVEVKANQIYQPTAGKSYFAVAEQDMEVSTLGSFSRQGIFSFTAPSAATFSIGEKVPVTVTSCIASVVAAHTSGDPALFIGRAVKVKASGSTVVEVEMMDFDDPA